MKNVHRIEIEGQEVFLKKGEKKIRVVYPIRDLDGKINWRNLIAGGSWWNLVFLAVIISLGIGLMWEYSTTVNMLLDCFQDPMKLQECKELYGPRTATIIIR